MIKHNHGDNPAVECGQMFSSAMRPALRHLFDHDKSGNDTRGVTLIMWILLP